MDYIRGIFKEVDDFVASYNSYSVNSGNEQVERLLREIDNLVEGYYRKNLGRYSYLSGCRDMVLSVRRLVRDIFLKG